jgi:hypothetical protein
MRKMPCLFVREFHSDRSFTITEHVTPGCEWVLSGEGVATIKRDGTACAVIGGKLFKRYDVKRGKAVPPGAIACSEPDDVTGHWPHWIAVGDEPASVWHRAAFSDGDFDDGTYELCGPKLQGNPEGLASHFLIRHGTEVVDAPRSFAELRDYVVGRHHEGLVFWREPGNVAAPMCKIRRADFGFAWPVREVA